MEKDTMNEKTILPVYLRVKPKGASTEKESYLRILHGTNEVEVDPPKGSVMKKGEKFSFSGVFKESCSQVDVYKGAVLPLVENVLVNQRDSLFFTMGSSGSGKSHTVLGYRQTPGMIQLAVDSIFKSVGKNVAEFEAVESASDRNPNRASSAVEAGLFLDWTKTNAPKTKYTNRSMCDERFDLEGDEKYSYAVYVSMVEIYNDRVFNLLDDSDRRRGLLVKTDSQTKKSYLADVQKIYVSERAEAFRVVEKGLAVRKANSTGLNDYSSRSHAFTTVEVKRIPKKKTGRQEVSSASLTIVDLAGSERNKTAKTAGSRLAESCAINQSLMLLGQCLQKQREREARSYNKQDLSIFRNCKLTQLLLANTFIPNSGQKTQILVTVDPYGDFKASSQILRYSALARDLTVPKDTRVSSLSSNGSSHDDGGSSTTLAEVDGRSFSGNTTDGEYANAPHKYLLERIKQLEDVAAEATERALTIEEQVREEMSTEMENQIASLQSRYLDHMDDDLDRSQQLADKKIDILTTSIRQEERNKVQKEIQSLQDENLALKAIIKQLRQEQLDNGTPPRKKVHI